MSLFYHNELSTLNAKLTNENTMGTHNDVVAALLVIFVIRATINVRINTITHGGSEDIIVSLSPMADDKPDAYRE